jgi:hypothetical protein
MDFLHGLVGFVWGILIFAGPWILGFYVISKLFTNLKLLNQSVIDLQKRVKELEKGKK